MNQGQHEEFGPSIIAQIMPTLILLNLAQEAAVESWMLLYGEK